MKLYLAGPMSGIENHNYPAFSNVAVALRAAGHEVVSPAELHPDAANIYGESTPGDYRKYLVGDLSAIAECDGLFLLAGYEQSTGAMLEIHFALTLGLPCYQWAHGYLESVLPILLRLAVSDKVFQESKKYWGDVVKEQISQELKWGEQNHDDPIWLTIVGEEYGEASQAILHDEFGGKAAGTLREEVVQLAAVSLAWIECIDRRSIVQK